MLTRRGLLNLGLVGALAGLSYGGVTLARRFFAPAPEFEPIAGLPGFRRLAGGTLSASRNPAFVGLGDGTGTAADGAPDCAALFAPDRPPERPDGTIPLAYFSDARCVFCRTLSPVLREMDRETGVSVTWHELPLLGRASELAARATLAAGLQGAQVEMHHRLMGTPFVPTEGYLRQIAEKLRLDADRLLRDMQSDTVDRKLAETAALARQFGFYGTPGMVIGRTVVLGNLTEHRLRSVLATERDEATPPPCA